ncbi:MAG: hypothetical protein ACK4VI_04525 [Alphaproteobacteria bacterium]
MTTETPKTIKDAANTAAAATEAKPVSHDPRAWVVQPSKKNEDGTPVSFVDGLCAPSDNEPFVP